MTCLKFTVPLLGNMPALLTLRLPQTLTAQALFELEHDGSRPDAADVEYASWMPDQGAIELASWSNHMQTSVR